MQKKVCVTLMTLNYDLPFVPPSSSAIVLCQHFGKYPLYLARNCHRNAACDWLSLGTLEDDGGAGQGRIHPERPGGGAACSQCAAQRRKGGAG